MKIIEVGRTPLDKCCLQSVSFTKEVYVKANYKSKDFI